MDDYVNLILILLENGCHKREHFFYYMYKQEWNSLETSPKVNIYRLLKTEHMYETYLNMLPLKYIRIFTRFRLCNHNLPIETGG